MWAPTSNPRLRAGTSVPSGTTGTHPIEVGKPTDAARTSTTKRPIGRLGCAKLDVAIATPAMANMSARTHLKINVPCVGRPSTSSCAPKPPASPRWTSVADVSVVCPRQSCWPLLVGALVGVRKQLSRDRETPRGLPPPLAEALRADVRPQVGPVAVVPPVSTASPL